MLCSLQIHYKNGAQTPLQLKCANTLQKIVLEFTDLKLKYTVYFSLHRETTVRTNSVIDIFTNCLFSLNFKPEMEKMLGEQGENKDTTDRATCNQTPSFHKTALLQSQDMIVKNLPGS